MTRWSDVLATATAAEARGTIDRWVAELRYPRDAVELVGAKAVREIASTPWDTEVPASLRTAWRERVATRALLRWEHIRRARLIRDAIESAADDLERRARTAGVRLPSDGYRTLRWGLRGED